MHIARVPARVLARHRARGPPPIHCTTEIVMTRSASRSLVSLAAVLLFPVLAAAQATHAAPPAAKPVVTSHPATASAATVTTPPTTTTAAHATAAPSATPKSSAASPAATVAATPAASVVARSVAPANSPRDARGRFIAKGATPAAANNATCKDGSSWSGAQRSGACARHGGVKTWR